MVCVTGSRILEPVDGRVQATVLPGDQADRLLTTCIRDGTAELVTDLRHDEIHRKFVATCSFRVRTTTLGAGIGGTLSSRRIHYGAVGVLITPA